jgi:hypothetical protein
MPMECDRRGESAVFQIGACQAEGMGYDGRKAELILFTEGKLLEAFWPEPKSRSGIACVVAFFKKGWCSPIDSPSSRQDGRRHKVPVDRILAVFHTARGP